LSFYYEEVHGICYSILTRHNTWTEPVSLQKNAHQSFYADIDSEDNIHLLFQDKQGNIFYSLICNASIKTTPVLNSKSISLYDKYLFLVPFKNVVHFFYILQHNDSNILAHQVLIDSSVSMPKVIDYVAKSKCPCSITLDKLGNLYAFYQASDGRHLQLGHKKYNSTQRAWGEFSAITRFSTDSEYPRVMVDNKNIMHICFQRRYERQYELIYQQKVPDKNIWTNEIIIHTSAYPFNESSIILINGSIIIYWVRDDIIYFSASNDEGNTWSKPARYNFSAGRQLMCISYRTNNPYENEKVSITNIPGNFINGIKLAFYQDTTENMNDLSATDLKNMIVDSLRLLKVSIEELKEFNADLKEDILRLNSEQQNIEKDLVKYSVKQDIMENDIRQVKNVSSRLDALSGILGELRSKIDAEPAGVAEFRRDLESKIIESSIIQNCIMEIQSLKNEIDSLRNKKNTAAKKRTTNSDTDVQQEPVSN